MTRYRKDNPLMKFDTWLAKVVVSDSDVKKISTKPMAIIFLRVSIDKQKTEWSWLESQEQSCRDWCKKNWDIEVIKVFSDEWISWKILNRKWMEDAIKFLEKENKKYTKITHFITTEISRIARPDDPIKWVEIISRIEATGAKLETTLEHRDTSTDEGKLMDDIKFSIARYERVKIMKRAKNGMVSRALHGKRPFGAVAVWYKKEGKWKNSTVVIDESKAHIISKWLELFANNVLISNSDLLEFFKSEWLSTSSSKSKLYISFIEKTFALHRLFFYAWYFLYPERWIDEPIDGEWTWIITLDTVHKIINKLQKGSLLKTRTRRTEMSEEFPLRWLIVCPDCGRRITARYSRSSTWKLYPYYGCSNKYCNSRENISQDLFERKFEEFLLDHKISKDYFPMFDAILREERDNAKDFALSQKNRKKWEKVQLENKLKDIQEAMLKTTNTDLRNKFEQDWGDVNDQKNLIEIDLKDTFFAEDEFLALSKKSKLLLENPLVLWEFNDPKIRQLLIDVRYWGDLFFTKKSGYRTNDTWLFNYFVTIFWELKTAYYPGWDLNPHDREVTRFWV